MTDFNFLRDLIAVIDKHGKEKESNTPDYVLAEYLDACLKNFNETIVESRKWHESQSRRKEAGLAEFALDGSSKIIDE